MIHPDRERHGRQHDGPPVFIIGPDKKMKLIITYPVSTGRNFDEILRVIDSLQLTANYSVATPVNWKDGEDVIIAAAVSDEDAKDEVPEGLEDAEALPARHAPAQQVTPVAERPSASPGSARPTAVAVSRGCTPRCRRRGGGGGGGRASSSRPRSSYATSSR